MHRRRGTLWLLVGFIALSLARPLPVRAAATGNPEDRIARQAQLVADSLDRLAVLLNFSSIGDSDAKRAALDAIAAAQAALARLVGDPQIRDAQVAAVDATDFALMAVARFLGGPDTSPEPHLGQIFGAISAAQAALAKLVRLIWNPGDASRTRKQFVGVEY